MRVSGRHLPVLIAIILLGCLGMVQAAQVTLQYTATPRTFKACALAIEQTDGTWLNSHPLVFEGLRRSPLKPAGWDFENPLAPPQVVAGLATVTKADEEYWLVELDEVTATQLQGLDIIYISAPEIRLINPNQREALIKAVRQGAIVWVDQADVGGAGTTVTSFLPGLSFSFSTDGPNTGFRRTAIDYNDWLLRYPFQMTPEEVRYVGRFPTPDAPGSGPTCDSVDGSLPCQPVLQTSDGTDSYRHVTVTPHGAGAVVVTAGEIGWDLESWWQISGEWWSADRLRRPSRYQAPSFKFAYNIVASAGRWSQTRRSSGADGRNLVDVRPPLQIDWQFPGQFDPLTASKIGPVVASPVYAGGMVFATTLGSPSLDGEGSMNAKLLCFDADPAQDLTGSGMADDWIPDAWIHDPDAEDVFNDYRDYSLGKPYDMVWSADFGDLTPLDTSPAVANMTELPGARPLQVVLVSLVNPRTGAAQVRCYNASAAPRTLSWVSGSGYAAEYEQTGALMWTYDIPAYSNSARVVALSTPVVHSDYVFVLASEFDSSLDGNSVHSTYGRAHAFKLSYEWDVDGDGPRWQFPDPNPDPANDGRQVGDADLAAFTESQGTLPPFHEPQWVAGLAPYGGSELPPVPGAIPVPHSGQDVIAGSDWDVHLNVATPVGTSFSWNAGPDRWDSAIRDWNDLLDRGGGWDIQLIPTPTTPPPAAGEPPVDTLNRAYYYNYGFRLPRATTDGTTQVLEIRREDAPNITLDPASVELVNNITVRLKGSGQARQLLLPAQQDGRDPHVLALSGARIEIVYEFDPDGDGPLPSQTYTDYVGTLRGIWRHRQIESANRRRTTPPVITGPDSMIVVSDAAEDADRNVTGASARSIRSRDRMTGTEQWSFDTRTTLPNDRVPYGPYSYVPLGSSAPAFDRATDTAYAVMNHARQDPSNGTALEGMASVVGLGTKADLSFALRPVVGGTLQPDARLVPESVTVRTLDTTFTTVTDVPATAYQVDEENARIIFGRGSAGWLTGIGSLYGKPVWVSYSFYDSSRPTDPGGAVSVSDEMHVLPDVLRFHYLPGFIRLNNRFVNPDSIGVTLPNGLPVNGLELGEEEFVEAGYLPGGWSGALPRGILDVRGLEVPTTASMTDMPLQPGSEIVVQYDYFDQITGTAQTAVETHQVPHNIGESVSSPAVGGAVLHVGTEGYDPYRDNTLEYPELHNDSHPRKPFLVGDRIRQTLLSLLWDPISGMLSGHMAQPARPHISYDVLGSPVVPAVSSSPVIGRDRVFVGSKMVAAITQTAGGYESEGVGFVSSLKSESTFICDDTRILEVVGQRPVWVAHGTLSPTSHERADIYRLKDERTAIPFNRPAKVLPLSNGNLLVVDTGNNRVVEIDRDGVVKWPLVNLDLDRDGIADPDHQYDYYTVPDVELEAAGSTTDLRLDSPSDVFRYYTVQDGDRVYNSVNGDLLPGTEAHTVIADSGNGRVIDVITTVRQDANGVRYQTHQVQVKTPSHVKPSGSTAPLQRIAYTTARPIFDPSGTANDDGVVYPVIGYLCAASDLHQLVVVEEGTKAINPFATNTPYGGLAGSDWRWLAWLWDQDVDGGVIAPPNPLMFRNIRDVQTSYEGGDFYLTVTCGQYAGRLSEVQADNPSPLAQLGDGVFEFVVDISGPPGSWRLVPAADAGGNPIPDTPVWYMTREDFIYSYPGQDPRVRRDLTNIRYDDVDGNPYWQTMPWFPAAATRLPTDSRPMDANGDGNLERYHRHLVVNHAGMIPNLIRANVDDTSAPALLGASVLVVQTNDANDNHPGNDTLDIDVRQVIPNPHDFDWMDPLGQPTSAAR